MSKVDLIKSNPIHMYTPYACCITDALYLKAVLYVSEQMAHHAI